MNSNLKLLPATLLVAVLALAGCGGGGSDDMTPDPAPMPTPEEECLAGGGAVYEDGECKTADDLREEGRDLEAEERDAAAAMAKRMADAEKFHGLLSATTPAAVLQPANLAVTGSTYASQIGDAEDGVYNEGMIRLMIGNTMGSATQADNHDGTNRDADNTALTGNPRHVAGSGFATGQNELKEHDNGDELAGTYMGASGTFTCAADDCTSRRTANGIQLAGTTAWTFVPNANSKYSIPDGNYARYGWWLDETTGLTGTARVGAWYTSNADANAVQDISVEGSSGTASYTGTAIGVAAYYHSLGGDANAGGAFTADAMLSANFDSNMLSGSITNFDVGGHNPDWSVALGSSSITPGTSAVGGGTTTWTVSGTDGTARLDAAGGGWTAQFYDIPSGAHQPTGVAGGFKAQYDSDGYMVGAFGAEQ